MYHEVMLIFKLIIFYLCAQVFCLYAWMCTTFVLGAQRTKKRVKIHGNGLYRWLWAVGVWNKSGSSPRAARALNRWAISPDPWWLVWIISLTQSRMTMKKNVWEFLLYSCLDCIYWWGKVHQLWVALFPREEIISCMSGDNELSARMCTRFHRALLLTVRSV